MPLSLTCADAAAALRRMPGKNHKFFMTLQRLSSTTWEQQTKGITNAKPHLPPAMQRPRERDSRTRHHDGQAGSTLGEPEGGRDVFFLLGDRLKDPMRAFLDVKDELEQKRLVVL